MNTLQKALLSNAIFSSLSGLSMLLFSNPICQLFGLENTLPFLIIGTGLLLFAATIFIEIKQQRKKAVLWICIQDILWVLGSIILLIVQPFGISTTGNILIAVVALFVFVFAFWQYKAVGK